MPGLDSMSRDKDSDFKNSCYQEIPEKPRELGESCVHVHTLAVHSGNSNSCTMVTNNISAIDQL